MTATFGKRFLALVLIAALSAGCGGMGKKNGQNGKTKGNQASAAGGNRTGANRDRRDLGRRISASVARLDTLTGNGHGGDVGSLGGGYSTAEAIGRTGQIGGNGANGASGANGRGAKAGNGKRRTASGRSVGVSTLVVGSVAFVGVDLTTVPKQPAGVPGSDAEAVKRAVRAEVHRSYPEITDVVVTTNPAHVWRLAQVSRNISSGVSTLGWLDELLNTAQAIARDEGVPFSPASNRR